MPFKTNKITNGMVLHQHKLIQDLLSAYGIIDSDFVQIPLQFNLKISSLMDDPLYDPTVCRQFIGK